MRTNGSKLKYKPAKAEEHGSIQKTSCFPVYLCPLDLGVSIKFIIERFSCAGSFDTENINYYVNFPIDIFRCMAISVLVL